MTVGTCELVIVGRRVSMSRRLVPTFKSHGSATWLGNVDSVWFLDKFWALRQLGKGVHTRSEF